MSIPVSRFRVNHVHKPTQGVINDEPTMTQQHFKDECSIDSILRKYDSTGFLVDPFTVKRPIQYGDFSEMPSFQEQANRGARIAEYFASLPAGLRRRFGDRVDNFVTFMLDPANAKEAQDLGLVELPNGNTEEVEKPTVAPVGGNPEVEPQKTPEMPVG